MRTKRAFPVFSRFSPIVLLGFMLLAAACTSPSYRYVPKEAAQPAQETSNNEVAYSVPPNAPEGTVRIRSMGIVDLKRQGEEQRTPAFHVRATLAKTSGDNPWSFNIREQALFFPNQGPTPPLFANSNSKNLPSFQVKTGEVRAIDLYFPLPGNVESDKDIPEFNFKWVIHPDSQILTETTQFQRAPLQAQYPTAYPYDPYPVGYGSLWWGGYGYGYWGPVEVAPSIRVRK